MEDEKINLNDLDLGYSKKQSLTTLKKTLIIGGVIALFIIIMIIIIVSAVNSGPSEEEKKSDKDEKDEELNAIGEIDCVVEVEDVSKKTQILNDEYEKSSKFDIKIDSIKIDYTTEYQFSSFGTHNIKFILYEDINMDYMFKNVKVLQSVILFSSKKAKIKSMISTFESCEMLNNFAITGFNLDEIKSTKKLFYKTNIYTLNLDNFNPINIEDMSYMFAFSSIDQINLNNLITNHTTNMSYMFYSCKSLKVLDDLKLNTSKVTDMSYMFSSCDSLTYLNLSYFDTTKVINMEGMFKDCIYLSTLVIDTIFNEVMPKPLEIYMIKKILNNL